MVACEIGLSLIWFVGFWIVIHFLLRQDIHEAMWLNNFAAAVDRKEDVKALESPWA